MNYRWQETIKILIPGFYMVVFLGIAYFFKNCTLDKDVIESIGKLSAILIALSLFLAFVVGFVNELISGGMEYLMYCWCIPRPSRVILNETFTRFRISKISDLKVKLDISSIRKVDNKMAAKCLRTAKQAIDKDKCIEYYYQSVLARNLFFAHVIVSIVILFMNFSWTLLSAMIGLAALLCWQWWKMNLVYVKNIFVEYLKIE